MGTLTEENLDALLSQTYYSWDTVVLFGGVVDFLEFSERNLSWLRRREISRAEKEGDNITFDEPDDHLAYSYRNQLIESAKYRFDVSLSQSIRYGGLVAFITAVELCAKVFKGRISRSPPETPDGESKHVFLFTTLNQWASAGFDGAIEDLRRLVHVRNNVVHHAGFVCEYQHENDLRQEVDDLAGFSIWKENWLGESVCIGEGAVADYAKAAQEWIPRLDEICTNTGIMK